MKSVIIVVAMILILIIGFASCADPPDTEEAVSEINELPAPYVWVGDPMTRGCGTPTNTECYNAYRSLSNPPWSAGCGNWCVGTYHDDGVHCLGYVARCKHIP